MSDTPSPLDLLTDLLARARAKGADAADAVYARSDSVSHAQRMGQVEKLERSESRDLGLRVFLGQKQAVVSSSDIASETLDTMVDRAIAMARTVPEDPYCGLADPDQLFSGPVADLDIHDPAEPSAETLIERARAAEGAALAVEGVTNSEGAEADWGSAEIALAASNGFTGSYRGTRHSVAVSVLAGEGTAMESDYEYSLSVFGGDLEAPEEIGRKAGEKAVRRLNPQKGPTEQFPVVYDPRVSGGLARHLAGAINGASIARGTSLLKDKMGEQVLTKGVSLVDDPHRLRGLRSKPFDAEGLANGALNLVDDGVLKCWVLDLGAARKLGLTSTGRASRGTSSPPSPATTNLYLTPGTVSPEDLMADIKSGFYVTNLMGMGINGVTGDYSRGASGFWIENGELTHPVSEMTIAGNLKDMFLNLAPANDLEFRYGVDAPTIRIDGMTVAGT